MRARTRADIGVLTPKVEAWPQLRPDDVSVRSTCERVAMARELLEG